MVSAPRSWRSAGGGRRLRSLLDPGQIDFEGRSLPNFAINPDVAAALLDNAIDHGEAQTRALALLLGGKKGLENARSGFFIHASRYRSPPAARMVPAGPPGACGIFGIQFHITGFNGKFAPLRHGIPGIEGQIDDDLFDLSGISHDPAQLRSRNGE